MQIVLLQLERQGTTYRGTCWESGFYQPLPLEDLKIGPENTVQIPGLCSPHSPQSHSLDELVQALIRFDAADLHLAFEERGQISIGQHLYRETLGRLDRFDRQMDVDLRILTDDEHLARLPWPLLARNGLFLVNQGWSISLVTKSELLRNVELPPCPKLLLVVPQPAGLPPTGGDEHRDTLRRLLGSLSPRMADAEHFHTTTTWDEYRNQTTANTYDIVYYYGHGDGSANESRLCFSRSDPTAMRDFSEPLGRFRPRLVYLNCCSGDAGGLLGAGRQLTAVTDCVVTNRSPALVEAAKAQGLAFWQAVLLDGSAPHVAVARNYRSLGSLQLSSREPHWFTPVIYANYGEWKATPPQRVKRYDENWKLKLDRVDQFGRLVLKTQDLLSERRAKGLAFIWYGEEGQGMERFHERLEVELQPRLQDAELIPLRTRWPDRYAGQAQTGFSPRAYEEMLLEAFRVDNLAQIDGHVRNKAGNRRALVVLNHPHAVSPKSMDPRLLQDYLRWWNDHVIRQFSDDDHFYLLAFSFRTKEVQKFRDGLRTSGCDALRLPDLQLDILQPLECIKRDDLLDFFQRHNIYVPLSHLDGRLDYILTQTKGRYEATLLELEQLVVEGYTQLLESEAESTSDESDDPFGMNDE